MKGIRTRGIDQPWRHGVIWNVLAVLMMMFAFAIDPPAHASERVASDNIIIQQHDNGDVPVMVVTDAANDIGAVPAPDDGPAAATNDFETYHDMVPDIAQPPVHIDPGRVATLANDIAFTSAVNDIGQTYPHGGAPAATTMDAINFGLIGSGASEVRHQFSYARPMSASDENRGEEARRPAD